MSSPNSRDSAVEIVEVDKRDEKDVATYEHADEAGTLDAVLHKHLQGATSVEDRQTAFELAMKADPGPRRWTWRWLRLYMLCLLMCLNQGDNGKFLGEPWLTSDRVRLYRHWVDQLDATVSVVLPPRRSS